MSQIVKKRGRPKKAAAQEDNFAVEPLEPESKPAKKTSIRTSRFSTTQTPLPGASRPKSTLSQGKSKENGVKLAKKVASSTSTKNAKIDALNSNSISSSILQQAEEFKRTRKEETADSAKEGLNHPVPLEESRVFITAKLEAKAVQPLKGPRSTPVSKKVDDGLDNPLNGSTRTRRTLSAPNSPFLTDFFSETSKEPPLGGVKVEDEPAALSATARVEESRQLSSIPPNTNTPAQSPTLNVPSASEPTLMTSAVASEPAPLTAATTSESVSESPITTMPTSKDTALDPEPSLQANPSVSITEPFSRTEIPSSKPSRPTSKTLHPSWTPPTPTPPRSSPSRFPMTPHAPYAPLQPPTPTQLPYHIVSKDPRFKALSRKYTALMVGIPLTIFTSYMLYNRYMGLDQQRPRPVVHLEDDV